MNFSPLPNESDEEHFNRVIVPILGSREELQISFGVKQTLESRSEALHESAAKEKLTLGFDSDGRPDSLTATIAARFDDLTAAEKAVRRICLDSGYEYTCSSLVIELEYVK